MSVNEKSIKDIINQIIDKIDKYIKNEIYLSEFEYEDQLKIFVIWLNINPEKFLYTLSKFEPILFNEKIININTKEPSWDEILTDIMNSRNLKLLFQIGLLDVSYLFLTLAKEDSNGKDSGN